MNVQTQSPRPTGARERSLEEVKAEFMRRAGRLNPFEAAPMILDRTVQYWAVPSPLFDRRQNATEGHAPP